MYSAEENSNIYNKNSGDVFSFEIQAQLYLL